MLFHHTAFYMLFHHTASERICGVRNFFCNKYCLIFEITNILWMCSRNIHSDSLQMSMTLLDGVRRRPLFFNRIRSGACSDNFWLTNCTHLQTGNFSYSYNVTTDVWPTVTYFKLSCIGIVIETTSAPHNRKKRFQEVLRKFKRQQII